MYHCFSGVHNPSFGFRCVLFLCYLKSITHQTTPRVLVVFEPSSTQRVFRRCLFFNISLKNVGGKKSYCIRDDLRLSTTYLPTIIICRMTIVMVMMTKAFVVATSSKWWRQTSLRIPSEPRFFSLLLFLLLNETLRVTHVLSTNTHFERNSHYIYIKPLCRGNRVVSSDFYCTFRNSSDFSKERTSSTTKISVGCRQRSVSTNWRIVRRFNASCLANRMKMGVNCVYSDRNYKRTVEWTRDPDS